MKSINDLRVSKKALLEANIKEELNKLFYLKPKYKEELEMLAYQYAQEEEERLGLHASSITNAGNNFCFREQIINILYMKYKKAGKKVPKNIERAFKYKLQQNENIPIHLARIYEEGKSVGTKWQRLFIRGGLAKKEDLDVSRFVDEYDLSYTPDGIIELNGKVYVVEIKSSNRNQFENMTNHPAGKRQLKLYMYMESEYKGRKIDGGFVLVDCKDNSDFKIFLEFFEPDEIDPSVEKSLDLLEKIQKVKKKVLKTKKLPPCKCGKCLTNIK